MAELRVPLLDTRAQNGPLREDLLAALTRVLDSGTYILGPEVDAFERELSLFLGCRHAIGVSSGSDALLAVLMALEVGPRDEVITTPFSFFATIGCLLRLGAKPRFVDIRPETFNLDPEAAVQAVTSRTRALIPVHLFGRPCALPACDRPVLEDAAQAIGAAPLAGLAGCLSFFPSKNLGALGDGGAIYTNADSLADRLRLLRTHGSRPKYVHPAVGGNFRLDALQAAVLQVKLKHLRAWTVARRRNADRYRHLFAAKTGLTADLRLPGDVPAHIYNQFVIRAPRRDGLRDHLAAHGVGTEIYYPLPLHLQPCLRDEGYREGECPEAERAAREVLALPIYPELTEAQQAHVVDQIAAFYQGG